MTDPLKQAREALISRLLAHAAIHDAHTPHDDEQRQWADDLRAAAAAISAQEVPAGEWVDSPSIDAAWQEFCRTAAYRQALGWVKDDEVPGALFVAFRAGLQYTAAPAAPKPAEAPALPERLMRFLLRDLKTERAVLEGFLSLGNEAKRAAEYDDWIAAVESYCQQYAPAAPQE